MAKLLLWYKHYSTIVLCLQMSDAKRQHTNPESHLREFTDENGQFFVYDKTNQKIFQSTPKNVCVQQYFYSLTTDNGERDNTVETYLANYIDPIISAVVQPCKEKKILTSEERQQLSIYVCTQYARTSTFRAVSAGFQEEVYKRCLDLHIEHDPNLSEISKQELMEKAQVHMGKQDPLQLKTILDAPTRLSPVINNRDWTILEAPNNTNFLTSDNPVGLWWDPDNFFGAGLGTATIFFPLTPKLCLHIGIQYDSWTFGYTKVGKKFVRRINKLTFHSALRQVVGEEGLIVYFAKRHAKATKK